MARAEFTSTPPALRLVDHDGTAAGQLHRAGVGGFDLVLDLEAAEQRCVVAVALHAVPCSGITWFMNWCACSNMSSVSIRISPMSC
jgi:hypothetical protein